MAWTPPSTTFAVGEILTAVTMNKLLNSLKFIAGTTSTIVTATVSATTTTFATKTGGPTVTAATGANALVIIRAGIAVQTTGASAYMGFKISGATTLAAATTRSLQWVGVANYRPQLSNVIPVTGLTPGSNIFTCQYRRGTAATALFANRSITVIPLP